MAISGIIVTVVGIAAAIMTEETIVLDLSCTSDFGIQTINKLGVSLVLDFDGGNLELYPHAGKSFGIGEGFTYSVGKIHNYAGPGSYGGLFVFAGGGLGVGVDACANPFNLQGPSATSITFSGTGSVYWGIDWYFDPITFNFKEGRFK